MKKREIVLDVETTGLDRKVDRVIEIGCVELLDMMPTGNNYHKYINPRVTRSTRPPIGFTV